MWLLIVLGVLLGFVGFVDDFSIAEASTPITAGYRDFSYGTSGVGTPTGEKPESKLWFNDGYWWGSLYNDAAQAYHIYRLDLATQDWVDTGVLLDDRSSSLADTLWDDTAQKLYVVSHIFTTRGQSASESQWGRLYRYSYDASTKTYSLDTGFPVTVTRGKSETLTVAKDSTGTLWVTYVEDSRVLVNHSTNGNDASWGTPFALPVAGADGLSSDDIAAVIAYDSRIGVMWSNQSTSRMYFAVHVDGQSDQTWQAVSAYTLSADDHINLKSLHSDPAGDVFAVVKTSFNNSSDPLIVLLACTSGTCNSSGDWQAHTVGRKSDGHTRPILLIDTESRNLHVFATSPESGGSIYHKSSSIDNIQFQDGKGTLFISSSTDTNINNPTSTKQNVNSGTGLVVLASDKDTNYYVHNYLDLGNGSVPNPPTISGFTPTSGPEGTQVTIGGSSLSGASAVRFNGTPASFSVVSDTEVTAAVPAGASTGPIELTTPAGTATSTTDFTVTTPAPTDRVLTVSVTGSGSVGLNPGGGVYPDGTTVTLTATADTGWAFAGWSGDLTGTSNPVDIVMDADKSVTATFTQTSGGGGGPVIHEETQTGGSTSSATVATTAPLTAAADNLYVAAVAAKSNEGVASVTGLGLSWAPVLAQCAGRDQTGVAIWVAQGTPTGDEAVTATLAGTPSNAVIAVTRYSGVDTATPVGATLSGNTNGGGGGCANGTDSSSYAFPLTTGTAGSVVYSAAAMRHKSHDPGAGFSERAEVSQGNGGSTAGVAVQDQTVASPATVSVEGSFRGNVDWAVGAIEIRPAN